jgi:acyl-CoA synthetase (AMP-forming)/AMP-acid ligase II
MSDIKAKLDESIAQLTSPGAPWELAEQTINNIPYRIFKNAPDTVKALIDEGRKHGDNEFIIYEGERWTFNTFFQKADQISYQLINRYGVKKGDRVAIAMRNYPEWMVAFTAISSIGGVVVPLNSWGQTEELKYGLSDAGAKILFCDQQRYNYIEALLPELGVTAIVARPDSALSASAIDMQELANSAGENITLPEVELSAEDLAMIMYTSGTTGNPKGAISCQRNMCQAVFNFEMAAIAAAMCNPEAIGKMLEKGFPPKVLLALPLFHVSGCYSVFLLSLRSGRPIVMLYKWNVEDALKLIEKEKITMVSAVPTMLWDMLESPQWDKYNTDCLFAFGAGGAAQPPRLPEKIFAKLPDSFPGTGYGMTETNAVGFSSTGAAYAHKPLSGGTASPIVDIKICDENGNRLPPGKDGEIWLRSPANTQGYWNKPEATQETFKDGWVITGDIGYLDEEGYIFLTDRIKDMVIRGGENIYSAEIESVIYCREDIHEVAAFGLPHDSLGEELAVVIYAKENSSLDAEEIQRHVAASLANFKVPTHVYFRNEELPKNATRKILKKQLRTEYLELLGKK